MYLVIFFVSGCLSAMNVSCRWLCGVLVCLNISWTMESRTAKLGLQICVSFYSCYCFYCMILCAQKWRNTTGWFPANIRVPCWSVVCLYWRHPSALNKVSSVPSVWSAKGWGRSQRMTRTSRLVTKKTLYLNNIQLACIGLNLSHLLTVGVSWQLLREMHRSLPLWKSIRVQHHAQRQKL